MNIACLKMKESITENPPYIEVQAQHLTPRACIAANKCDLSRRPNKTSPDMFIDDQAMK
jgi:hypothetical protein